jgi:hypothetical protein
VSSRAEHAQTCFKEVSNVLMLPKCFKVYAGLKTQEEEHRLSFKAAMSLSTLGL